MASGLDKQQGSLEWLEERKKRINGSELADLIGYGFYKNPRVAMSQKIEATPPDETQKKYFAHGHAFETPGLAAFIDAMNRDGLFRQSYTLPSAYFAPSRSNKYFTGEDDDLRYGVSLDGEGSLFDVEVKNPYQYASFKKNYLDKVQVAHFIQCQWAMAIRERESMYYTASHFDPTSGALLATVIWKIDFDPEFFSNTIYPLATTAYLNLKSGSPNDLPWMRKFDDSVDWKIMFQNRCTKVFSEIKGERISDIMTQNNNNKLLTQLLGQFDAPLTDD